MKGFFGAFKAFFTALGGTELVVKEAAPALPVTEEKVEEPRDRFAEGAVFTLNLLQRDGRLIDFLMEDITPFSNDQVGAAVREVHKNSRETIDKYFGVAKLRSESEGSEVNVEDGYDVEAVRLTGHVADAGPYRGTLRHGGWQAAKLALPEKSSGSESVIAPAQLEC